MSLLSDRVQCLLSLVSGNPETRRVVTSQFSDAHSQFPLSTLEAEVAGSAGGTHLEMRLLRGCEAIFPFFFSQITFLDTVLIFEKSPERDHDSREKGREVSGERIAVSVRSRRGILYGFGFPPRLKFSSQYTPHQGLVPWGSWV